MAQEQKGNINSPALGVVFAAFIVVILISLFRWTLIEHLTPFIEPTLEVTIGLILLVSLVCSVVHLIWARKQSPGVALSPLLVNVVALLMVAFFPFDFVTAQLDFRAHYKARMAVVSTVLDGGYENLAQNGGRADLIALPAQLSYLSSGGGDIMRWRRENATLIFFFDYRGILDSFSGFVYSTDDSPPREGDFGGHFAEIKRLRQNWFWATSRN
jgi:hypothetical protein